MWPCWRSGNRGTGGRSFLQGPAAAGGDSPLLQLEIVLADQVHIRRVATLRGLGHERIDRLQQLCAEVARYALGMGAVEPAAEVAADNDAARIMRQRSD